MIAPSENTPPVKLLMDSEQACEAYAVSRKTLYVWSKEHGLPCLKIDGCLRWPVDEGREWIKRKMQESHS